MTKLEAITGPLSNELAEMPQVNAETAPSNDIGHSYLRRAIDPEQNYLLHSTPPVAVASISGLKERPAKAIEIPQINIDPETSHTLGSAVITNTQQKNGGPVITSANPNSQITVLVGGKPTSLYQGNLVRNSIVAVGGKHYICTWMLGKQNIQLKEIPSNADIISNTEIAEKQF